jgi:nucleoside-diphosphate kinase
MGDKLRRASAQWSVSLTEMFDTNDPVALGRIIYDRNVQFLASGPVVAAVAEGFNAVRKTRLICGSTLPCEAAMGSIRGDFASVGAEQLLFAGTTVSNLVHASDNDEDPNASEREIAHWFAPDDISAP